MIKDLIVNLSFGSKPDPTADFAVSAANQLNAHVMGVSFFYEPVFPAVEPMAVSSDLIDFQIAENERLAANAKSKFEELVQRNSVSGECRIIRDTQATAPDTFARLARRFDLSVVSQPGSDSPGTDSLFVEAALFNTGRPVLVVPYIQRSGLTMDRVLICWDGSRTAARAIADAMPFLTQAKTTEIMTVNAGQSELKEIPGADIAHHLARHGIEVELKNVFADDVDTAAVILSHVADVSADLIVMGGYGHSRWREFVLGGVTRGLLASMTVPTLMAH
jgi:nucleotide-binding universal stress UspA family protein